MVKTKVLVGFVFLAGCVVGGVSSQFVAAPARAGTNPTRWEYACGGRGNNEIQGAVNQAGLQGWELVAMSPLGSMGASVFFCMKRPLP